MITGGTPAQARAGGARSNSGGPRAGATASPVGLHRVIEPAGSLPQAAWRLDPSPELWPDETRVRVDRLAPVLGGDMIEATATVVRVGRRSRELVFEARVVCRADPDQGPSASRVLAPPLTVVTARGTVVVPVSPNYSAPAG